MDDWQSFRVHEHTQQVIEWKEIGEVWERYELMDDSVRWTEKLDFMYPDGYVEEVRGLLRDSRSYAVLRRGDVLSPPGAYRNEGLLYVDDPVTLTFLTPNSEFDEYGCVPVELSDLSPLHMGHPYIMADAADGYDAAFGSHHNWLRWIPRKDWEAIELEQKPCVEVWGERSTEFDIWGKIRVGGEPFYVFLVDYDGCMIRSRLTEDEIRKRLRLDQYRPVDLSMDDYLFGLGFEELKVSRQNILIVRSLEQ